MQLALPAAARLARPSLVSAALQLQLVRRQLCTGMGELDMDAEIPEHEEGVGANQSAPLKQAVSILLDQEQQGVAADVTQASSAHGQERVEWRAHSHAAREDGVSRRMVEAIPLL